MKYRKKPVVIEAVQITDDWFDGDHPNPLHPIGTEERPVIINPLKREVAIYTLEGIMTAVVGDWLITGVKGECYPCKPDIFELIFELTYEKVE